VNTGRVFSELQPQRSRRCVGRLAGQPCGRNEPGGIDSDPAQSGKALGDPAMASDGDVGLDDLRRAIMQLPDEYREPLVMQVLGGLTTNEIAAELKLTQQAVLTRLFRARNRLRTIYGLTPAEDLE